MNHIMQQAEVVQERGKARRKGIKGGQGRGRKINREYPLGAFARAHRSPSNGRVLCVSLTIAGHTPLQPYLKT